jgi:hypothetical protein
MKNFKVTIERNGKTKILVFRKDDYTASIRHVRHVNGVIMVKYGSGKLWKLVRYDEII